MRVASAETGSAWNEFFVDLVDLVARGASGHSLRIFPAPAGSAAAPATRSTWPSKPTNGPKLADASDSTSSHTHASTSGHRPSIGADASSALTARNGCGPLAS